MKNALIGYSGFVGSTLLRQTGFEAQYRSTNIQDIRENTFDVVVCAGAPAQKWIANQEPENDRRIIEGLIGHLDTITCRTFILISTVDVFLKPIEVDEGTAIEEDGLHPYGLHRAMLEKFVKTRFPDHVIVRLPGLVGPGLRKNIIFDFLNDINVHQIDSRGVFQFYPMVNLWYDIQAVRKVGLKLIHLTAEPISVAEVSEAGFGQAFDQALPDKSPATYDLRTKHAEALGGRGHYQYTRRETVQAIRTYAQSEPRTLPKSAEGRS